KRLREELFPSVDLPDLPLPPEEGASENAIERRAAELDTVLSEYGRIDSSLEQDRTKALEIDQAWRDARRHPPTKVRMDQCTVWVDTVLQYRRAADEASRSVQFAKPEPLSDDVRMRAPFVWLLLGLIALV